MINVIKTTTEFNDLIAKHDKVLVDFHASWCGPCKIIAPKIEEFAKQFQNIFFIKIDVDVNELEPVATKYDVSAMPTFIFFKGGEKVDTVVGASEDKVKEALEKLNAL